MTDNDIIKALDILCKIDFFGQRAGMELWNEKPTDVQNQDIENHSKDIAFLKDFFNRQQAEIERLKKLLEEWKTEAYKVADEKDELYCNCIDRVRTAKAEAVKEFVDKVENEIDCQPHSKGMQESAERYRIKSIISNLLKEVIGENVDTI